MRKGVIGLLLFLFVVGLAGAQKGNPLVLLQLTSGHAQLADQDLKLAEFGFTGQELVLSSGSEVKVSLLGESSVVYLKGPLKLRLERGELKSLSSKSSRPPLQTSEQLGGTQKTGSVERPGKKAVWVPSLVASEGGFDLFLTPQPQELKRRRWELTLWEGDRPLRSVVLERSLPAPLWEGLTLEAHKDYQLKAVVTSTGFPAREWVWSREFRILSPGEQRALESLLEDSLKTVPKLSKQSLLQAASVCVEFRQYSRASEFWRAVSELPSVSDALKSEAEERMRTLESLRSIPAEL